MQLLFNCLNPHCCLFATSSQNSENYHKYSCLPQLLLLQEIIAFWIFICVFIFQSLQVFRALLSAIQPEVTTWRYPGYMHLDILIIMKWSSGTTTISSKQKVSQRMKMNVCSLIWSQGGSTVSRSAQGVGNTKLAKGSMAEQVSKHPGNILRHSRVIFFYLPYPGTKISYDFSIECWL